MERFARLIGQVLASVARFILEPFAPALLRHSMTFFADVTDTFYPGEAFIGYSAQFKVGQGDSPETFVAVADIIEDHAREYAGDDHQQDPSAEPGTDAREALDDSRTGPVHARRQLSPGTRITQARWRRRVRQRDHAWRRRWQIAARAAS
jgi:hypothetical protein